MLTAEINRSRRIGVEYEFAIPQIGNGGGDDVRRTLAEVLNSNGLRTVVRGYSHRPLQAGIDLAVEYDASVRGESRYAGIRWQSVELKTCILEGIDHWEQIVPKALDICRYLGGRVNASTGHHVHVSMPEVRHRPAAFRSLFNAVHRYEQVIYGLVAPSRRTGSYAAPMLDRPGLLNDCGSLAAISRAMQGHPRTSGFNPLHLFDESPRWEARYHGGTLSADKARHWLRFMLRLTDHATVRTCKAAKTQLQNDRAGLDKMLISLGLRVNTRVYSKVSPELRETGRFLLSRWKQLNSDQPQTLARHRRRASHQDAIAIPF